MVSEHASPLATLGGVDAGGQNVFVSCLASALARQGVQITVYTRRDDPELPEQFQLCPGVVIEHVQAGPAKRIFRDRLLRYMPAFGRRLRRRLESDPPALVHAHFWMSGLAARAASQGLEVPFAQTFHALGSVKRREQGDKDTSPPQRVQLERELMKSCDRVIATCSDEVFELVRQGADQRRIAVVPGGVDLDVFHPDGPALARPQGASLHVVVVSRLVERKGVGNLVTAIAQVPGAHLSVAGGPPRDRLRWDREVRRYRRLAADHGAADRVHFRGSVSRTDVAALIRGADVLACVPWYEPFGMTALEGMACGVPVVATAVGGLVDTVIDGVTGLHVPPRRPDEIADALLRLQRDPALRRRLGAAGVQRARERYGWDSVAAATLDVYRRLVSRARVQAVEARR